MFKLRGSSYIKSGRDFYFARVDFEYNQFVEELWSHKLKKEASSILPGTIGRDAKNAWGKMRNGRNSYFGSSFTDEKNEDEIKAIFARNCVIYFPSNRFEEPAWLNQKNLNTKANYMDITHLEGHTNRNIINYSPLLDNQNWLFDVVYDMVVFELQPRRSGPATINYEIALEIIQRVMNKYQNIRFGIGMRRNRVVSIMENDRKVVPNIFQLSSGEVSLLNLFLSILRDFDLSGATITKAEEIRGIVIVDEIDLHLHAVHQYMILPELIKMFPRIQFIVTTHSPLFVLGMEKTFGEDGFALSVCPWDNKSALKSSANLVAPTNRLLKQNSFWMIYNKLLRMLKKPFYIRKAKQI